MDAFTQAYLETLAFTEEGDTHDPGMEAISAELIESSARDCARFQEENQELIYGDEAWAGHDFWLTRNRHGAGFWDGGWPEHGDQLTRAAHAFGPVECYTTEDGVLYSL
jgi:hypothetical protein